MSGAYGWKLLERHGERITKLIAVAPAPPGNIQRPTYHFAVAEWRRKTAESRRVKYCGTLILAVLFASLALSEDFKTTNGKVYKDATVTRVEADGIELKTKTGISKVYFTELPQEVQERFHWAKPEPPREPFYGRWAVAAEDPAALARIIAFGASIIAGVALVISHIRSRRQPTIASRTYIATESASPYALMSSR